MNTTDETTIGVEPTADRARDETADDIHVQRQSSDGAREHRGQQQRTEQDLLVPLVDEHEAGRIYDSSILWWALIGAAIFGFLLGWLGYAMADGGVAIAGLGQWATGGTTIGAVTGGGVGLALGGLLGALAALYRMPPRRPEEHEEHEEHEDRATSEHRTALEPGERVVAKPVPEHRR